MFYALADVEVITGSYEEGYTSQCFYYWLGCLLL